MTVRYEFEVTIPAAWARWLGSEHGPLRGWGGGRMPGEVRLPDPPEADGDGNILVGLDETAVRTLRGLNPGQDGRIEGDEPGVLVLGDGERDRYPLARAWSGDFQLTGDA